MSGLKPPEEPAAGMALAKGNSRIVLIGPGATGDIGMRMALPPEADVSVGGGGRAAGAAAGGTSCA